VPGRVLGLDGVGVPEAQAEGGVATEADKIEDLEIQAEPDRGTSVTILEDLRGNGTLHHLPLAITSRISQATRLQLT
jgi:hypothetical protein